MKQKVETFNYHRRMAIFEDHGSPTGWIAVYSVSVEDKRVACPHFEKLNVECSKNCNIGNSHSRLCYVTFSTYSFPKRENFGRSLCEQDSHKSIQQFFTLSLLSVTTSVQQNKGRGSKTIRIKLVKLFRDGSRIANHVSSLLHVKIKIKWTIALATRENIIERALLRKKEFTL